MILLSPHQQPASTISDEDGLTLSDGSPIPENPIDDEPMWAADRVVAPTPGSAITIPETVNEFAIKDTMTMKMDARYKEFQSYSKQPNPDYNDDDKPMSPAEKAKFMKTFRHTRFHIDYRNHDSNHDNWRSSGRNDYNRDNYRSNSAPPPPDKLELQVEVNDYN
ncbi:hypothetical protein Tco_0365008 [Tanacetum coccineum]